jgi:hypothetical protein
MTRLAVTALSLFGDGEPAAARIITGNRGCNLWVGGIVINGSAETFRDLARAAAEAAKIEEDCDALKRAPHQFEQWPIVDYDCCRFCGAKRCDTRHAAPEGPR